MDDEKSLPECRYGSKCYRKNEDHLKKFSHPPAAPENGDEERKDREDEPRPKRRREDKKDGKKPSKDSSGEEQGESDGSEGKDGATSDTDFVPPTASYDDRKNIIKQYFLFDMPDDFYALWDLALHLNSEDPRRAFSDLGLILCGPFDVMAGHLGDVDKVGADEFLLHCRYYYDVPEFQTVIRQEGIEDDEEALFHIGYLRDEPTSDAIVCSNDGKDCKLTILGDNLFAAIGDYAKSIKSDGSKISKLTKALAKKADKSGFSLDKNSRKVKERKKQVVAKTFHGAGIVVPVENDVGYRPLGVTDEQLRKTLQQLGGEKSKDDKALRESASSKLQELVTYVQFANDECDFGMGYELGIDIFCTGFEDLHSYAKQLLSAAYSLLKREQFKTILTAHLAKRRRGKPFIAAP